MSSASAPSSTESAGQPERRTRARAVGRRVLRGVVTTFLVVTVLSLTFNALTTPPKRLDAPTGADVDVRLRDGRTVSVHYERWGDAASTQTPLVLVHGFAESTVSWSLVAPQLAKDRPVVAVDLAGSGYSQYSGRYSLDDQSDLVLGVVEALQLDKPTLVGHSLGAAVVGAVALEHPDRISGIVFADGDALPFDGREGEPPAVASFIARTPYALSLYRLGTHWNWFPRRIFDAQCGSVCHGLQGAKGDALVDAWIRPLRQRVAEEAMLDTADRPMLHLTPEQVRAIRVPRAVLWGEEDATGGGSREGAERNLGHPPSATVANAGHLSMVADPDGFVRALNGLLGRMTPAG